MSLYKLAATNIMMKKDGNKMIKAAIFDLDGTLSYTLDSISISGNLALESIGMQPFDKDRYRYFVGDGAQELVKRLLIADGDEELVHLDELMSAYKKYFAEYANYKVQVYEGMPETLKELKTRGIKLAVLSNKPHPQTIEVVKNLYGDIFDYIQGNTPEIKRKPSSDGALIIADKLGVDTSECLYIGDTATDMMTGNGAGMHTIGVLWGYRDLKELTENNAEFIIEKPCEILGKIGI